MMIPDLLIMDLLSEKKDILIKIKKAIRSDLAEEIICQSFTSGHLSWEDIRTILEEESGIIKNPIWLRNIALSNSGVSWNEFVLNLQ